MGGLHLQRLAGVVRGELASDYGELPGKRGLFVSVGSGITD